MKHRAAFRRHLLASSLLLGIATPALAQTTAPSAESTQTQIAPDDEQSGLSDIVVTATKRETSLQKTPIAINVVNDQAIKDRHIQSLYDLADGAVPSLRVATFEARQTALTIGIRGIVPLDANQPAREQGVGIYIDGVYLGRQHGLNAALFDVDRIEVLKGPQGTLFGRNTEGGALSIVTKAPSGVLGGRATAGVANYGGYNFDGHLDLPKTAGISVKFDGVIQHQNPTIKDPLAGSTGWNFFDRRAIKITARWQPASNFTADVSFDRGTDRNTPFYSQLLNYNPNGCVAGAQAAVPNCYAPGTNFAGLAGTVKPLPSIVQIAGNGRMDTADIAVPQQQSVDETFGWTGILRWDVAPALQLRSITAWRGVTSNQYDNSGGAHRVPVYAPNGKFSRYSLADLTQHQFSQELQAVGTAGRFDYVAGLYYFEEKASDDAATPSSNQWNADGTGYTILDPTAFPGSAIGARSIDRASYASSKSYAAYGQVTWNLLDPLHLTAGGRYTHDDKSGTLFVVNNAPTNFTFAQKTDRFNPLVTLAYDVSNDVHVYAKYTTGYRAGGASSRSVTYRQFGPEDATSYEIGAKTELFDRHVRLNLAGYIMDRDGSQVDFSNVAVTYNAAGVATATRNTLETINAPGTTRIRGIEADATWQITPELSLTGSYAYTYTRIPPVQNPFTGVTQTVYIVYTPRNAASGAIDYAMPLGFATARFHMDANYAQSTQTFDQYAIHNDASILVNGRLALSDIGIGNQKATISLWVRNMLNEAHVYRRDPSNSLPGVGPNAPTTPTIGTINSVLGDYGNFNAPRTFGAELSVKF